MSKKKGTRPNVPQETLARARAELHGEVGIVSSNKEKAPTATVAAARESAKPLVQPRKAGKTGAHLTMEDLKEEYSYVTDDLRKMAILTLGLVAFIIIMAVVFI